MLVASCGDIGFTAAVIGRKPFSAPEVYRDWWRATETCSARRGNYDRIVWYTASGIAGGTAVGRAPARLSCCWLAVERDSRPDRPLGISVAHRWRRTVTPLGHPTDLKRWCFFWERLDPSDHHSLDEAGVEQETRALVTGWARASLLPLQPLEQSGLQ